MTAVVKLANESALGIYVLAWTSPSTGSRCTVTWFEGAAAPSFSFHSRTLGKMTPEQPIASPERFGWTPPRKMSDFKAFAQRYADALETAAYDDLPPLACARTNRLKENRMTQHQDPPDTAEDQALQAAEDASDIAWYKASSKEARAAQEYHPACVLAALDHDNMGICSRCWSLGTSRSGTTNGPDVTAQIAGKVREDDDLSARPCPSEYGPGHHWICLVSEHGATAPYGCQHCPATTTGAGIRPAAPTD